jgi:copper ion binding protein
MISEQFIVPAVSCQHCINAVSQEVGALAGVQRVAVDLDTKIVTVEHAEDVSAEAIIAAINEAGYEEVMPVA